MKLLIDARSLAFSPWGEGTNCNHRLTQPKEIPMENHVNGLTGRDLSRIAGHAAVKRHPFTRTRS